MANRDTSTWYAVEPAQTVIIGAPNRIRTGVIRVKGGYPRPLDDGSMIGGCGWNRTTGFNDVNVALYL